MKAIYAEGARMIETLLERGKDMRHPHAELMAEYAKDAMETDRPWERWEFKAPHLNWMPVTVGSPQWFLDYEYRRKPRTITINGIEVPEPVRRPLKRGQEYWTITLGTKQGTASFSWDDDFVDYRRLRRGMVHLTKENARRHAEALILASGGSEEI